MAAGDPAWRVITEGAIGFYVFRIEVNMLLFLFFGTEKEIFLIFGILFTLVITQSVASWIPT